MALALIVCFFKCLFSLFFFFFNDNLNYFCGLFMKKSCGDWFKSIAKDRLSSAPLSTLSFYQLGQMPCQREQERHCISLTSHFDKSVMTLFFFQSHYFYRVRNPSVCSTNFSSIKNMLSLSFPSLLSSVRSGAVLDLFIYLRPYLACLASGKWWLMV